MKKRLISLLLILALCLGCMPMMAFAKGGEKPTLSEALGRIGFWISDREEPNNFIVSEGKISFTVKETPAVDAWNAWQGRGAFTVYDGPIDDQGNRIHFEEVGRDQNP